MARHGRCRCGTLLQFRLGPWGYKRRCPQCGSIVRLRLWRRAARPRIVLPDTEPDIDVDLWPAESYAPAPHLYWPWVAVGMTVVFCLVAILALIWFLKS
ncbi:MAG TPA: hypothetical protein VNK04_14245 [Gemmataceae bacterium]|nr:hypothetical protein [Gemmataceae bacterium]